MTIYVFHYPDTSTVKVSENPHCHDRALEPTASEYDDRTEPGRAILEAIKGWNRQPYAAGTCPRCGTPLKLMDGYYKCPVCGYRAPR